MIIYHAITFKYFSCFNKLTLEFRGASLAYFPNIAWYHIEHIINLSTSTSSLISHFAKSYMEIVGWQKNYLPHQTSMSIFSSVALSFSSSAMMTENNSEFLDFMVDKGNETRWACYENNVSFEDWK